MFFFFFVFPFPAVPAPVLLEPGCWDVPAKDIVLVFQVPNIAFSCPPDGLGGVNLSRHKVLNGGDSATFHQP